MNKKSLAREWASVAKIKAMKKVHSDGNDRKTKSLSEMETDEKNVLAADLKRVINQVEKLRRRRGVSVSGVKELDATINHHLCAIEFYLNENAVKPLIANGKVLISKLENEIDIHKDAIKSADTMQKATAVCNLG